MKGRIWNVGIDRYTKKLRKRSCSLSNGLENEKHILLNCRERERQRDGVGNLRMRNIYC
jgi:hypothetical protein